MATVAGFLFRLRLAAKALTCPADIRWFPVGQTSLFDFLKPLLTQIPEIPRELMAATQPELGQAKIIESSEPEVARTLYGLALLLGSRQIVEVGVFRGFTSEFLAAALDRREGHLHLVDLNWKALDEASLRSSRYVNCRIEKHLGRSTDPSVVNAVPDNCDLIFLDADHSEEGVAEELAAWLPKLRNDGIIAIHDTIAFQGVCRAVTPFAGKFPTLTMATCRGSGLTMIRKSAPVN